METISQGTKESTAGARAYFWKIAVREFKDHPIIGVGPHNFGIWFPDYVKSNDDCLTYARAPATSWGRVAHSLYFTLLAELGIIGVILFVCLIYSFEKEIFNIKHIWMKFRSFKASNSNLRQAYFISLGLNGALIGFLVSALFLSVLYYVWMYFLLALLVGLSNAVQKSFNEEKVLS
jgi:O-antigen ligase